MSKKEKIHSIIFKADTPAGKAFDIGLLVAILLSVLLVILDTVPQIHHDYKRLFFIIEWVLTGLFAVEYLLRIYSSESTRKYVFSTYGIIDFIAVLPSVLIFLVEGTHYAIIIRLIRIVRVFKILNLRSFMENSQVLVKSMINSFYKIAVFMLVVLILVIFIGTIMFLVEGPENGFTSIPKSIYWTIVTITTVGFGDITPQTNLGQFISSIIMLIGYAIIAVPTGIVTVELTKGGRKITASSPIRCNNCQFMVANDDNYCKNCGHQMKKNPSVNKRK